MPLDFSDQDYSGQNLRGRCFKGRNLTGANFCSANIKGADFSNAILINADFRGAKAGLQRRWTTGLLIVSWLLAVVSGIFSIPISVFVTSISDTKNVENFIVGVIPSIVVTVFFIVTLLKGLTAGSGTIPVVVAVAVAVAFTVSAKAAVAVALAGTFSIAATVAAAVAAAVALIADIAVALATAILITFAVAIAFARPSTFPEVFAFAFAGAWTLLSTYIGWRSLAYDEKDVWVRSVAIAFAAFGGTSFRGADLTDADFTEATLKSTDFRKANLTRICWRNVRKLDHVRLVASTYLKNAQIRQLLVTGQGQGKKFDRQNLRGVNLQGANLAHVSFIDTDLSQANLQAANLFEAKLVQTNLDQANLSNACLTGTYIEDWGITRKTRLEGVECKYVYLKLPTEGDRDPNRMPPSNQGDFGENDFSIFITSVLDTLDLYHKQEINSSVAITVLKGMTQKYLVKFEMVGLENRGNRQFVIRLKVYGQTSHSQLQREYYSKYEQTLPMYDPRGLLPDADAVVAKVIEAVNENPGIQILNEQGIVFAGGEVSMNIDQSRTQNINTGGGSINNSGAGAFGLGDITGTVASATDNQGDIMSGDSINQSGNFGVGVNKGEVKTEKLAGTINEAQQNNLVEAAAEIQQLLKQLEQSYPSTTTSEQMVVAAKAIERIESNPSLKKRVINAVKEGGLAAFEKAIDNPAGAFIVNAIKGWQEVETE